MASVEVRWWEHFGQCWRSANHRAAVLVVAIAAALYGFASTFGPFLSDNEKLQAFLLTLPTLHWWGYCLILLLCLLAISIDGGRAINERIRSDREQTLSRHKQECDDLRERLDQCLTEFQGMPQLEVEVKKSYSLDVVHELYLKNTSDSVAVNIGMSSVRIRNNVTLDFVPVTALARSSEPTAMEHRFHGLNEGITTTSLIGVLALFKLDKFSTTLEFSNFADRDRWRMQCHFTCDFDLKEIHCTMGESEKLSR